MMHIERVGRRAWICIAIAIVLGLAWQWLAK